jgi:hypothetical protein
MLTEFSNLEDFIIEYYDDCYHIEVENGDEGTKFERLQLWKRNFFSFGALDKKFIKYYNGNLVIDYHSVYEWYTSETFLSETIAAIPNTFMRNAIKRSIFEICRDKMSEYIYEHIENEEILYDIADDDSKEL